MPAVAKNRSGRLLVSVLLSGLTTFALGLDMSIALPNKLIETLRDGFWGIIDNLLISMNHFHTMDHLIGAIVAAGLIFLYRRFLFARNRGWGEYVLSAFFALTMLISEMLSAENSIKAIWAGGTQLLKTMIFLAGLWPLFLCALRALLEGVKMLDRLAPLRKGSFWDRHPFACPFWLMALCWFPYLVMKYPGGMSPDATVQTLDWLYQSMELSHPPVTSVVYGVCYELGLRLGRPNEGIFLFTLLQTLSFLAVLAFICEKMRAWGIPRGIYTFALAVFCFAPNYSGWTTVWVKDVPYVIASILLCVLLVDCSLNAGSFVQKPLNHLLFIAAGTTAWLWRRNGIGMTLMCALIILLMVSKAAKRSGMVKLLISIALTAGISLGVNNVLPACFNYRPAAQREVYSHMLQFTGRVACEYPEAYTEEEIAVIDRIMVWEDIPRRYDPIITDGMKMLFREDASEEDYQAFRELVIRKGSDYPLEYADAYINLIYRLFDIRADRGDYIARREISHPYHIRTYSNELYDQQALEGLNAAQEAVENWNYWFADLPLIGLLVNIGFCVDLMLAMCWVMVRLNRRRALAAMVPALLTAAFCLFSPLVYIRYALPITSTLPLWFTSCAAHGMSQKEE